MPTTSSERSMRFTGLSDGRGLPSQLLQSALLPKAGVPSSFSCATTLRGLAGLHAHLKMLSNTTKDFGAMNTPKKAAPGPNAKNRYPKKSIAAIAAARTASICDACRDAAGLDAAQQRRCAVTREDRCSI